MNFIEFPIEGFNIKEENLNDMFWKKEKLLDHEIVYVQFGKSRSKQYHDVVQKAETLPNYHFDEIVHCFTINNVQEYVKNEIIIEYVISLVNKWKDSKVILNGKPFNGKTSMWHFKKVLQENAGEYYDSINPYMFYDFIPKEPIEDLPLPYVLYPEMYGSFFAFKESKEAEDIYFCECEKKAIENYLALKKKKIKFDIWRHQNQKIVLGKDEFPVAVEKKSSENLENPLSMFKFRKGICHKCNGKLPQEEYCVPMYGTAFKRQYGWFINQRYFEYGIDYMLEGSVSVQKELILREKCPIDILKVWDNFIFHSEESEKNPDSYELYKLAKDARRDFEKCIENTVRKEFGFKNVGEAWVSETTLANIIKVIYPNYKIRTHYRPHWLGGLELDIYVEELNLGIEYQGQQHYQVVEHWGGKKQLEKQKEHDTRKKSLCHEKDVKLLIVNYDEPLTESYIRRRLKEIIACE